MSHAHIGAPPAQPAREKFYRHSLAVRVTHWVNVLCLTILLVSGLQIFNAHPALYWGAQSDFDNPLMSITAEREGDRIVGVTTLFGRSFETTGLLGVSGPDTTPGARAFPAWITLPSYQDLATGRRWHFFFAWLFVVNGLFYLLYGFASRHLWRDLVPASAQLRGIGGTIADHLRLRFHRGAEARHYNVLQKLAYLGVIFILLPLSVLSGLTMSPALNAAFPQLLDLFGGRQSARTLHFVAASLLVAFVFVHVIMVLVSGAWNNLRSMLTGWFAPGPAAGRHD